MKVIVLGAGLVGGPMAADLAQDLGFEVGVADINREALVNVEKKSRVVSYHQDLSNPQTVRELIKSYDLVLINNDNAPGESRCGPPGQDRQFGVLESGGATKRPASSI